MKHIRLLLRRWALLFTVLTATLAVAAQEAAQQSDVVFDPTTGDFTFNFELSEVVINGDIFEGYSPWKSNPARDLVRELIDARDLYRPNDNGCLSRQRHDILAFALTEAGQGALKKMLATWPDIFVKYIDVYPTTEPNLNLTNRESSSIEYFQAAPGGARTEMGTKYRSGIDDFLTEDQIDGLQDKMFCEADIFSGNIELLDERFTSPLSPLGTIVYRFAILDTLIVDGYRCIDLAFAPVDPCSYSFTGHIYVDASERFIRRIQMNTPPELKMNYVKNILLMQTFEPDDSLAQRFSKKRELTYMRFAAGKAGGASVRRECNYSNYIYEGSAADSLTTPAPGRITPSFSWRLNRGMMTELRTHAPYRLLEDIAMMAYNNYLPSSLVDPKMYWGPVTSFVSINSIEGLRFRVGGKTTAHLNPHLGGKFYVAYGTRDRRFKYMGELEYSFNRKKDLFDEFPFNSLRLHADNDLYPIWKRKPDEGWDNIWDSWNFGRFYRFPYALQQRQELSYNLETRCGLSGQLAVRHHTFTNPDDGFSDIKLVPDGDINQMELEIGLRYAPGEELRLAADGRHPLHKETPIFTLTHTMARSGLLGTNYNYQHTEFTYRQRHRFGAYGYADNTVRAGRVWTPDVPAPLLIVPNVSSSGSIVDGEFTSSTMKLLSDRYIAWNVTCKFKGILFNHIPVVKKWRWREIVGARTLWLPGTVLEHATDGTLFDFDSPYVSSTLAPLPSIRMLVGIDNIFNIVEVDYYRRITYRDVLSSGSDGIEVKVKLQL